MIVEMLERTYPRVVFGNWRNSPDSVQDRHHVVVAPCPSLLVPHQSMKVPRGQHPHPNLRGDLQKFITKWLLIVTLQRRDIPLVIDDRKSAHVQSLQLLNANRRMLMRLKCIRIGWEVTQAFHVDGQ